MNNLVATGSLEGPRWGDIPGYLKSLALRLDINLKIIERKGWIRSEVIFRLEGEEQKVKRALGLIQQTMDQYNGE